MLSIFAKLCTNLDNCIFLLAGVIEKRINTRIPKAL